MIIFNSYFEHLVFAVFIGVGLDYLILDFMISEVVLFYPALLLGALYPDIDHPGSFLGKRFDFISKLINEIFWGVHPALTGFTVGFLSHVLGDLTNGRVQLLYPLQKKKFGLNSISVKHLKQK